MIGIRAANEESDWRKIWSYQPIRYETCLWIGCLEMTLRNKAVAWMDLQVCSIVEEETSGSTKKRKRRCNSEFLVN